MNFFLCLIWIKLTRRVCWVNVWFPGWLCWTNKLTYITFLSLRMMGICQPAVCPNLTHKTTYDTSSFAHLMTLTYNFTPCNVICHQQAMVDQKTNSLQNVNTCSYWCQISMLQDGPWRTVHNDGLLCTANVKTVGWFFLFLSRTTMLLNKTCCINIYKLGKLSAIFMMRKRNTNIPIFFKP